MAFLRRVLYLQAAVFFLGGLALAIAPRLVLVNLFSEVAQPHYAWVQIVGVQAMVLAMFMVLVAQRSEQVWWWSWTFVIVSAAITVIAVLNALFGLDLVPTPGPVFTTLSRHGFSTILWWLLAAVNAAFTLALLWGLGKTGQERPLPQAD
ncbi:MAG: hypothetical protein M3Q23_12760 [Actinomycetota bacterium]|nr:hypothetical protein [Actinomycetota bacterium]